MVCQQPIQAAQTGLCMMASIKNGSIYTVACLQILVKQAKTYGRPEPSSKTTESYELKFYVRSLETIRNRCVIKY